MNSIISIARIISHASTRAHRVSSNEDSMHLAVAASVPVTTGKVKYLVRREVIKLQERD